MPDAAGAGYLGILMLMFVENVFPPIPSEVIMPAAGFRASQGSLSLPAAIMSGVAGSFAGAVFWYYVGRTVGEERLRGWIARRGYWIGLYDSDLDKSQRAFELHGLWIVGGARLVPGIRTLISVPAGVAEMPAGRFMLATGVGTLGWTAALAGAGYALQNQYEQLGQYLRQISFGIVGLLVLLVIVRAIRRRRRQPH